jgi:hypothetical protein
MRASAAAPHPLPFAAPSFGRALGALLPALALLMLNVALSLFVPGAADSGVLQTLVRLVVLALILFGLWRGVGRAALPRATWVAVAVVLVVWQALAWWLALNGAFQPRPGIPALPLAIVLPLAIGLLVLLRSGTIGRVLDAIPPGWLIGLQTYRVLGSVFLVAWATGTLPTIFALPAGFGDTLVGLLALPVALYVSSGSRIRGVSWNLLGLLDLVNAVALGALTTPGPLQLIVPDHPSLIGSYPLALVPAFAVPLSMLLHALSLRQLRRLG